MGNFARNLTRICLGTFALLSTVSAQTPGSGPQVEINFDEVLEWNKPCAMTPELLESKIAPYETVPGSKLHWSLNNREGPQDIFSPKFSTAYQPTYAFFKNPLRPHFVHFYWKNGFMEHVTVIYSAQEDEEFPPQLLTDMDAAFGVPHTFDKRFNNYEWSWENYSATAKYSINVGKGSPSFVVVIKRIPQPGETPPVASVTPPAMKPSAPPSAPSPSSTASEMEEVRVNLDELIDWKAPVSISIDMFDAKLQALEKAAGKSLCRTSSGENYQVRYFDALNRARKFKIKYSIFGGQYFPTSAYVDWKGGSVLSVELTHLQTASGEEIEPLQTLTRLDKLFGCSHVAEQAYAYSWNTTAFYVVLIKYSDSPGYGLRFYQPRNPPVVAATVQPPATATPVTPGKQVLPASDGTLKYTMDLDPLINWDNPMDIEAPQIETIFAQVVRDTGHRLWTETEDMTVMGWGNPNIKMTLLQGRLPIIHANVYWGERKQIFFRMLDKDLAPGDEKWLYNKLDEILKVDRTDRKPANNTFVSFEWTAKNCVVRTSKKQGGNLELTIWRPVTFDPKGPSKAVAANLDFLLTFPALWSTGADSLEKMFTVKTEKTPGTGVASQFEWVNSARDRARFSRQMFSNVETKLTMFGGSIKLEEAILEFVSGKAARATISFYNRGDSGDIEVREFDRIFKLIGQNLSQVMKVTPKRQIMSSNAALPVTGWMWTTPQGIALLEYIEYNTPGKVTKPEFLRLKLAAPNQADWSMGKLATGIQRMELLQRVTKKTDGDVYITGVPMVDQGAKGYCVAASCQRLFEYMRIPCDQHEMARLVGVDADGADVAIMQKSLAKIDGAFKVTFKPLVNPEQFYASYGKRRVSEKEFISLVKEYIDKGVPLLWGLALGEKPEDPPLPGTGQLRGGHMRMIIGYNVAKNKLLFTDSWGAGHELKRMAMLDAYDVTLGLFSMAPRGL